MSKSQNAVILRHLQCGRSITPLEALNKYGCMRLGARIYDLKQKGVKIVSQTVKKAGKHYSSYRIQSHGTG